MDRPPWTRVEARGDSSGEWYLLDVDSDLARDVDYCGVMAHGCATFDDAVACAFGHRWLLVPRQR
jgi:hypothetical protein